MFTMSDAEVLPSPTTLIAAEHVTLRRNMCAHTHDFAELVLITAGEGDHFAEVGRQQLHAGMLLLLGPNSWHSYAARPSLTFTNLYMGTALLSLATGSPALAEAADGVLDQLTFRGAVSARTLTPVATAQINSLLNHIVVAPDRSILQQLSTFFAVLDQLLTISHTAHTAHAIPIVSEHALLRGRMLRHSARVSHAISVLYDQIERSWSLQSLAACLAISPSQLVRAFRAELHVGPMTYLQQLRAERMAYLLRTTDLTVSAAGRAVGWNDPSYASRRFSAHWGTSPLKYRARVRA